MRANLIALMKACDRKGVEYKVYHLSERLVEVFVNQRSYLFVKFTTPLNPQSVSRCCLDKDYFYTFFQDAINMPRTQAFMDPNWQPQYAPPEREKNLEDILDAIEIGFDYPAIVKRNSGGSGQNIFKVNNRSEARLALEAIFDVHTKSYDKIALAQDYLQIEKEYRAVYLNGLLSFAYEKNIDEAEFDGNLSPLHWSGAKAILIEDEIVLSEIQNFCHPIFQKLMIPFCGLDVAIDRDKNWWLIEANSSPVFNKIVTDGGEKKVISLYEDMLDCLKRDGSNNI